MEPLPPEERLLAIGLKKSELTKELQIYEPAECQRCNHGYKGRFAILEVLVMNDELKRMVIDGASGLDLKKASMEQFDMITLRRCALLNCMRGITSIEEVLSVTMKDF